MTQKKNYYFDSIGRFVIEQYNDQSAFSSFLPGIAGAKGRPAWVFYVNRGQAIASFGVRNKDGAFLEFFPADKAYQLTPSRGFRTFLKISDDAQVLTYEPLQRGISKSVRQRMFITPHEVGVEEINPELEFSIRADMYTMPEASVAGLIRRVEICNTSSRVKHFEIVDGLPQVLPYAMNQWIVKFMSRTSEAFMRVEGVDENMPFYRLKVWPTDSPQVEPVIPCHFFAGFFNSERSSVIVDAQKVFGLAGDFSRAERFWAEEPMALKQQVLGNQTPSAFQTLKLTLQPGDSQIFYGVYGHVTSTEQLTAFAREAEQPGYFEAKRTVNRDLIVAISQRAFSATAKPLFDAHVQQCYLDNGLRGGFSQSVPGGAHLHLFGRKHGDLERDYNDFLLQDTAYSEGNGDFRDVLQNRRMDVFFDPALDTKNIHYFFNLIQADGYNPCSLRNTRFVIDEPDRLAQHFHVAPALEELLSREFKYAELWQCLQSHHDCESLITGILAETREIEDAEFDRGYWSDHWTYLLDVLLSYQAMFPDRMADLFSANDYSFFDPSHFVQTRAKKYVMTAEGLRQYGAVQFSAEKQALMDTRSRRRHQARTQYGQGDIIYTTLLGKILVLVCNKLASLDPSGIGIEMEADRPGWCDALNGLPGILGSAVNETLALKRLVDFTLDTLSEQADACPLPFELAEFLLDLQALLKREAQTAHDFWRDSGLLKETYRQRIFMGFDGQTQSLQRSEIQHFLTLSAAYLAQAIRKAFTKDGIVTYFRHEAEDIRDSGNGTFEVLRFRQKSLPLFLEGFVHALRIANPQQAQELFLAVQNSALFDRQLGMYRLNEALGSDALELGRIGVFNDGWLENGSIFLHMHYKFALEMLRAGLVEEFYQQFEQLLVAFRDPEQYKRNPVENSSFLVSSSFSIDPQQWGRGCVARLSGSTVELLHLWIHLFLGAQPFVLESGRLCFKPSPLLASDLFSIAPRTVQLFGQEEWLPANSASCVIFSKTLLVYINAARKNTFGNNAPRPVAYRLYESNHLKPLEHAALDGEMALWIREGKFRRIEIVLDDDLGLE